LIGATNKEARRELKKSIFWKLQVVLTKCDLVERSDLARRIRKTQDEINEALPGFGNMLPIMTVSSVENKGIVELQRELASLVTSKAPPPKSAPPSIPREPITPETDRKSSSPRNKKLSTK
jgi:hypothetical protein